MNEVGFAIGCPAQGRAIRSRGQMTKKADGPTTRRMGFGFHEARAAGAPFRPERTTRALRAERVERDVERLTLN